MANHTMNVNFFPECIPNVEIRQTHPDGIVFDININIVNTVKIFINGKDTLPFLGRVHDAVEAELGRIAKEYGDEK